MLLNVQLAASNVRSFNAEANSQGPSVADIRKVEVQKDTSTNPSPVAPKPPKPSSDKKADDDEEKSA